MQGCFGTATAEHGQVDEHGDEAHTRENQLVLPVSSLEPVVLHTWVREADGVRVEQGYTPNRECICDEVGTIPRAKVGNTGYTY